MKYLTAAFILFFLPIYTVHSQTFFKGADLSYVRELEECGVQWKENNTSSDILSIFKANGANTVRFRIWHTPATGMNGYLDTETMISRAKEKGMKVILDFHYSDTWADPGKQKCPAAWMPVVNNYSVLADSLYDYTWNTLQKLKGKGLMPDFVQVGNETNGGMCFPGDGTVTWPTDWTKQTLLFNAGIKAVHDVDTSIKIILHVADPKNALWWAGQLNDNNVSDYDILGVSFYPVYHTTTTINNFGSIIGNIKNTYQKKVMVVETGLPWTNSWDDNTTNMMNGVPVGYGSNPTPEVQAKWLNDLTDMMVAAGGIGIIYWEPAWVASHIAACPAEPGGSPWENIAFFDFSNNLMTEGGIKFCQRTTGINLAEALAGDISLNVTPNPAHSELTIRFKTQTSTQVLYEIYDLQGRLIKSYADTALAGSNTHTIDLRILNLDTGMYFLRLVINEISSKQSFILLK